MINIKNIFTKFSLLTLLVFISSNIYADLGTAIGIKVGTQGFGLDARFPTTRNLYTRIGANYFQYSNDLDTSPMNYRGRLSLFTVPLMLDYHPTGSGFKISAGVAYNGNKVTLKTTTSKTVYINNHRYTPTELGEIKSTVKFGNDIAPIISLGYDSSFLSDGSLSFNFEAGLMYAGDPKVKVSATGNARNHDQQISDLRANIKKSIAPNKKYLRLFPILSIGVRCDF
jgi:hypothetical protein